MCSNLHDDSTENESVFNSLHDETLICEEGRPPITLSDLAECFKDCKELLSPLRQQSPLIEQSFGSMCLLFDQKNSFAHEFQINEKQIKTSSNSKKNELNVEARCKKVDFDDDSSSIIEALVPSSMKEWASLLSYCSTLSSEINNQSDNLKRLKVREILKINYKNLVKTAVNVGVEALLHSYVQERLKDLFNDE
jgi:hypothetical protein